MTTARAVAGAVRRVAILGPSDLAILRNRDGLIQALVERRHAVLAVAPAFDPDVRRALNLMGAETVAFAPPPARFRFLDGWQRSRALAALLADWRADAVLGFGLASMVEAMVAAKRAKCGRAVALVNQPLDTPGADGVPVSPRALTEALRAADSVIAHNANLLRQVDALSPTGGKSARHVVPGAGVDLAHHAVAPLPPFDQGLVFLMVARLETRQGVQEFLDAARQLKALGRRARFVLVATPGQGPDAIAADTLAPYAPDVEIMPPVTDIRPVLAGAHVYVHPAHAEGMPRTLAEALAAGRPVIATDAPGCREAVDERVNGCLVPPRDTGALVMAIETVLRRPDLIPSQARASRAKAERRFDIHAVNRTLIAALGTD